MAANTVYAYPLFIEHATPVARVAIMVGTPTPGAFARLAVYTARRDVPVPDRLLVGSMTEYDMAAAAGFVHELLLPGPPQLPRGIVAWVLSRFSGGAQPRVAAFNINTGASSAGFQRMLGATNPNALFGGGAGQMNCRVSAPLAYADPWPTTIPGWTIAPTAPASPVAGFRIN